MPVILYFVFFIVICLAVLIGRYFYANMHYDEALMLKVKQTGYKVKSVKLPDGSIIGYGEGPDNGPALLLIHGQTVSWEDYDTVLPQLSKSFHVFAVDCYGHGKSSHEADLYSCRANGEAILWFADNVIKENFYISGHSSGGILAAWVAANTPDKVYGLLLEDPPFFSVTPYEVQKNKGAFTWFETYTVTHDFVNRDDENDFPIYYLKHSYFLSLFGGLQKKIVASAEKYRRTCPDKPIGIYWFPHAWIRPLLYMDNYDPRFGNAFYEGIWMKDIDQERMLKDIKCPVVYLKAKTLYGKDGILYAANSDEDADRLQDLIDDCERINIKSGHDIHYDHPYAFIAALEMLLKKAKI